MMSEYSQSFIRMLCDYAAIAIQNATLRQADSRAHHHRRLHRPVQRAPPLHPAGRAGRRSPRTIATTSSACSSSTSTASSRSTTPTATSIGSRLLSEVGGLMKRVLGPENACFRYGGDEFVALLPGLGKQARHRRHHAALGGAPRRPNSSPALASI